MQITYCSGSIIVEKGALNGHHFRSTGSADRLHASDSYREGFMYVDGLNR